MWLLSFVIRNSISILPFCTPGFLPRRAEAARTNARQELTDCLHLPLEESPCTAEPLWCHLPTVPDSNPSHKVSSFIIDILKQRETPASKAPRYHPPPWSNDPKPPWPQFFWGSHSDMAVALEMLLIPHVCSQDSPLHGLHLTKKILGVVKDTHFLGSRQHYVTHAWMIYGKWSTVISPI